MKATERNCSIADKIIKILVDEKCTIEESQEILSGVSLEIRKSSTVQPNETLMKRFMNVL